MECGRRLGVALPEPGAAEQVQCGGDALGVTDGLVQSEGLGGSLGCRVVPVGGEVESNELLVRRCRRCAGPRLPRPERLRPAPGRRHPVRPGRWPCVPAAPGGARGPNVAGEFEVLERLVLAGRCLVELADGPTAATARGC